MSVLQCDPKLSNDFFAALKAKAPEIERRHRELSPTSAKWFAEAREVFPGGYTRDAVSRQPYPLFIDKGEGSVVVDCDGRRLNDFWLNATSLPLGHADPRVVKAVRDQTELGSAYFAPSRRELELAEILKARLPSAGRVRFTNSGSEAVMIAVRIARAHTGRDLVVKFEGSYHGIYDDVYWSISPRAERVGPADRPTAVPYSAGLVDSADRVLVLPYNNPEAVRRAFSENRGRIAAVIVEPIANRIGLILPEAGFLEAARECCDADGAMLIFDEVIAFRLGYRGAQGALGVTPDVTTLGKLIGGGFPVGGIVGRTDVMAVSEPLRDGRVSHSGTFNANPVTMAAGRATLEALTPEVFETLNEKGEKVRTRLREICDGLALRVTGAGSLFKISATEAEITDYRGTLTADREWERVASLSLLNEGFFLTQNLQGCLATTTTDDQIEAFLAAFQSVVKD